MHAINHDPRRVLLAALAAFILAVSTFAAPRALDDLSLGGGSGAAADSAVPPVTQATWVKHPLASPVAELRTLR
jgi:hypothetical protein